MDSLSWAALSHQGMPISAWSSDNRRCQRLPLSRLESDAVPGRLYVNGILQIGLVADQLITQTDGSPHPRGQSVGSSISSQSFTSARPYHSNSSEEPHYNIVLDLDDLVDINMLPRGSSSGTEDDVEIDDTASVSTAPGPAPVGDTSRWNRVPIGAFRSAHPSEAQYASLGTAVFNGTRNAAFAGSLSFHGGVAVTGRKAKNGYIPVSPVLFPAGQSLRAISQAKSRKDRRRERKQKKGEPSPGKAKASHPSADLQQVISPLFSGIASGVHIPPLSLGEAGL